MKFYKLLIFFLLFSITLEAAYLRSVRVGSFQTKLTAQKELAKLNRFIASHKNLVDLQNEWGFDAVLGMSGKYHILIIQPVTNKKVVQEIVDTIRVKYPDSYIKKIKPSELKVKPIVAPEVEDVLEEVIVDEPVSASVSDMIEEDENISQPVESDEKEVVVIPAPEIEVVEEKEEEVVVEVTKEVEKEVIIKEVIIKELQEPQIKYIVKDNTLWKVLFWLMASLFLVALVLFFISKKRVKKEQEKKSHTILQCNEKNMQYSSQIKNNDNFLSEAQTSMSSVVQYSNLLLEFDLSVVQKDYVRRIKSSSEGLLNVINNTSDISKMQVGELEITNVDFNIKSMIDDVYNIIALDAKQNNVAIKVTIADDIPSNIIGDSTHLKQVLVSLLTNSVKYTRNGEISLTLKKVYSYAHAITLSFIVSDTGVGMSPEQIESILSSRDIGNSTNLCVSKQLIQKMNGDMKIYSTLDVGTTFTFNIKFDLKQ